MNRHDTDWARRLRLVEVNRIHQVNGVGVDVRGPAAPGSRAAMDAMRRQLGLSDRRAVLFAGRTMKAKGIWSLLAAARHVLANRRDVVFLVAGSGPEDPRLAAVVADACLADGFRLLGWRRDVPVLMAFCGLFVLPSRYMEGLPVTILEAMAAGKPVVATRHRGCEDAVVDGRTGLLVPVGDDEALAEAIERLLGDPALAARLGEAGRRRVEQHYQADAVADQILDALDAIVASADKGSWSR